MTSRTQRIMMLICIQTCCRCILTSLLSISVSSGNIVLVHSFSSSSPTTRQRRRRKVLTSPPPTPNKTTPKSNKPPKELNFVQILQTSCHSPRDILRNVGRHLTPKNDANGRVASLSLVRLSKMMIAQSNSQWYDPTTTTSNNNHNTTTNADFLWFAQESEGKEGFTRMGQVLARAIRTSSTVSQHDIIVEGIKAAGVISRMLCLQDGALDDEYRHVFRAMAFSYQKCLENNVKSMESHHLSGVCWAFDCLRMNDESIVLPDSIAQAYEELNLPFRIRPGFMSNTTTTTALEEGGQEELTLSNLQSQVQFLRDEIKTTSTGKVVQERRETAWQGDDHVPGFAYSGKVMDTMPLSPVVRHVRDTLHEQTSIKYDCCLLNLYPGGDSGMRYHSDPDQGELWGYDTCVVSVGASRRFSFREVVDSGEKKNGQPHMFVVMDGDVTEMNGDCQIQYQHAVKPAEEKNEKASRSSLVFKQYLPRTERSVSLI